MDPASTELYGGKYLQLQTRTKTLRRNSLMPPNLCVDEVASLSPTPLTPLSSNRSQCHPANHHSAIAWKSPKEATLPPVRGSQEQTTTTDGIPQPLSLSSAFMPFETSPITST